MGRQEVVYPQLTRAPRRCGDARERARADVDSSLAEAAIGIAARLHAAATDRPTIGGLRPHRRLRVHTGERELAHARQHYATLWGLCHLCKLSRWTLEVDLKAARAAQVPAWTIAFLTALGDIGDYDANPDAHPSKK